MEGAHQGMNAKKGGNDAGNPEIIFSVSGFSTLSAVLGLFC